MMTRTVPRMPCDRKPYPYPPVGNAPTNKRMTTIRMIRPMSSPVLLPAHLGKLNPRSFPRLSENSPCSCPERREGALPDLVGTEFTASHLRPQSRWEANLNSNNDSKKKKIGKE